VTLCSVTIDRVRNLEPQEVSLAPGLNLLFGNNAQGKTSFLEAVGLVCLARSFRQSPNAEVIRFGEPQAAVSAELASAAGPRTLRLAMDRKFKYAFVDRQRVHHLSEYLEQTPPVVSFRIESLAIGRGSPEVRRQFLDGLLVGAQPPFLAVLRRYQRALVQRNTALRSAWNAAEMDGFERELASAGTRILQRRQALCERLSDLAGGFQRELGEQLAVRYRSSFDDPGPARPGEPDEALYLERLQQDREGDRRQGFTRRGPHRDDLVLVLGGRSLRRFGSQGQVRSAVLSLKVAEIEVLTAARGVRPLLLLDDVSADLDEGRRERLFGYVAKDLQAFASTTEPAALGLRPDRILRYEVRSGRLHAVP
jgi:DNA replication and repair protein RecF